MAGGKETPRQKMIGMMYLVLTALLAMNISKDVLNAFVQINRGLGRTSDVLTAKAQATLDGLANYPEKEKAAPFLAKAQDVDKLGNELIDYIELLKARVMACSMSGNPEPDDATIAQFQTDMGGKKVAIALQAKDADGKLIITKLDENQNNTTLLIGADPRNPHDKAWSAVELKNKLIAYRDALKATKVTNISGQEISLGADIIASLDSAFTFNDELDPDGLVEKWETNKFFHTPLAAVIATMSKIETDVLNAKTSVMSYYAASINATDMKFSDITAAAVPLNGFVLRGGEYKMEVYLAAFNKTSNTKLYVSGSYDGETPPTMQAGGRPGGSPVATSGPDGKCIYTTSVGSMSIGPHGYTGYIGYMKDGQEMFVPWVAPPFYVGEPSLVVSPVNMMVLYRNIPNPVEIAVPGVPKGDVRVSCSNGSLSGPDGSGVYQVTPGSGGECDISVSATVNGQGVSMPPRKFKVKNLPTPIPRFGGITPMVSKATAGELGAPAVLASFPEDFVFQGLKADVTGFELIIMKSGGIPVVSQHGGSNVPGDKRSAMGSLKKGDRVAFTEIKCSLSDGRTITLPNLTVTVK